VIILLCIVGDNMKCPRCGNIVLKEDDYCKSCNLSLSFTTKSKNSYKKIGDNLENAGKKINKLNGKIILISAIAAIVFISILTFSSNVLLLFKFLAFIQVYSTPMIVTGVLFLVFWLILFFKKVKGIILKIIFTASLILIIVPVTLTSMINFEDDISFMLKDYSKAEYIKIGKEKIPSLYSVVGYRKITFHVEKENYYDEETGITMDIITIIYDKLSKEEKKLYKEKLLDIGFSYDSFTDEDGITSHIYYKDTGKNSYYAVSTIDNEISYSKGNCSIQELLSKMK